MRETLTILPTHGQPERLPVSQTVTSPGGRPYSPYPFRDLPRTPSPGKRPPHLQQHHSHHHHGRQPTTKPGAAQRPKPNDTIFSLFPYLPTEIRLQIWREAMHSACPQRRVLRLRLAVAESTSPEPPHDANDDGSLHSNSHLQILPTRHLALSTQSIRSLLASCPEARCELLPLLHNNPISFAQHNSVPLSLPDTVPLWYSPNGQDKGTIGSGILRCNLRTDLVVLEGLTSDLLLRLFGEEPQRRAGDGEQDRRGCSTLLGLEGVLSGVRHIGLDVRGLLEEIAIRGVDQRAVVTALIRYYTHLTRLMWLLCRFREVMDAPALMEPSGDEKGLGLLRGVKLKLVGRYVVAGQSNGIEGGLQLSSPERSLEIALGSEPRWMQWEWVCQCLGC
ncbi:uncharacterized protein C8A04DRAFT_11147 [Dichotomopilus funicola]|uniref:2EXR domain-containing protein n=1 Tax=Dichotomopilus funicola TaxID=1934379 RepID=A0AAN6ZNW9_9PEZI|nr:hypothetical protein C8A04DRAFT_11147 [Dichotomopilus funicola]